MRERRRCSTLGNQLERRTLSWTCARIVPIEMSQNSQLKGTASMIEARVRIQPLQYMEKSIQVFCESATIQADSVKHAGGIGYNVSIWPTLLRTFPVWKVCNHFGRIRSSLRIGSKNNSRSRVLSG